MNSRSNRLREEAMHSSDDANKIDGNGDNRTARSTIKFPYGGLDEASSIAQAVHENYGLQCSFDQLAAQIGSTTTSGSFKSKLATTRCRFA